MLCNTRGLFCEIGFHQQFAPVIHVTFAIIISVMVNMSFAGNRAGRDLRDGSLLMGSPLVLAHL